MSAGEIASRTSYAAAGRDSRAIAPGVGAAAAIAVVATVAGGAVPLVGAPVIAIVCGMLISAARGPAAPRLQPGIAFAPQKTSRQRRVSLAGVPHRLG